MQLRPRVTVSSFHMISAWYQDTGARASAALMLLAALAMFLMLSSAAKAVQPGDIIYSLEMSNVQSLALPEGASWVNDGPNGERCLKVSVPADRKEQMNAVRIPIDLRPYRGMQVSLECMAKAQDVSKPPYSALGVKCMLHFNPPTGDFWFNQKNVYGTFDWQPLWCRIPLTEDVTEGELWLGIQGSSGTAWIRDVRIVAAKVKPVRPEIPADLSMRAPVYRGHSLPRLRGVMSPTSFKEDDFSELARWNVNVIRWQIVRNWGKERADRDLVEYDRWMDGKINELSLVLDSAQRHGIKVMIDMHSPPGGRELDGSPTMLLDQKYLDHFIHTWEKIATRFKDHPALWAYDLINEPAQNIQLPAGRPDWLGIQVEAAKAIRKIDPKTAISIEVEGWDSPEWYPWMTAVDVPNVIYQVHMYWHGAFTHQGVFNDWGVIPGDKLVRYPGKIGNNMLDKEALRRYLKPVRDFQLAHNVHIFVGEFSAVRWAPGADQYLSDLIEIFEEYGWDWTYHAFREWSGWSVEHADAPADAKNHPKATETTARAKVLKSWYEKNQHPPMK